MKRHAILVLAILAHFAAFSSAQVSPGQTSPGVFHADAFPGADIGARINAAFASAPGTASASAQSVLVELTANATYNFATTIVIPNNAAPYRIAAPILDCHGAELHWIVAGPQVIADDLGTAFHGTRTLSAEPGGTAAQRLCENLDAGTFKPGDPVTTDTNGNLIDAGAAFTGTKTTGACTFTIVKGLIVNVTGC